MDNAFDLYNLEALVAWEEAHPSDAEQMEHYLAASSAIGFLRAAQVALRTRSPYKNQFEDLVARAYRYSTQREEQLLCQTLLMLNQAEKRFQTSVEMSTNPSHALETLRPFLEEIRLGTPGGRSSFNLEVEFRILYTLAYISNGIGQLHQGLRYASELKNLAHMRDLAYLHYSADILLLWSVSLLGQVEHSLSLHQQMRDAYPRYKQADLNHVVNIALLKAELGDFSGAEALLCEELKRNETLEYRACKQTVKALWAHLGPDAPLVRGHPREVRNVWLPEVLQGLIALGTLEPIRSKQGEMQVWCQKVLTTLDHLPFALEAREGQIALWIRAYALRQQGKGVLAETTLLSSSTPAPDALMIRVLHAGLCLELALSPLLESGFSIIQLEDELRAIFDLASKLSTASVQGLADLLTRWHPWAAIHGALMPRGIAALQPATEGIVQVEDFNRAYGRVLPPLFISERFLSAFGINNPPPELNAAMRQQRSALQVQRGDTLYWRPIFSGLQIAYGLLKAEPCKTGLHQTAARLVLSNYVTLPRGRSDYGRLELEALLDAFRASLEAQKLNPFHQVQHDLRG